MKEYNVICDKYNLLHSHFLFTKVVQLDLRSSNFAVLNGFDMDFVCQFYHIFSRGFIPRTWNPVAITLAVASHNKRRLILTFTIAPVALSFSMQ